MAVAVTALSVVVVVVVDNAVVVALEMEFASVDVAFGHA